MTPQELKYSIIFLALQGKLVGQNKDDSPVDLSGIKSKNTEECEFDIPDSWGLAHLETVTNGIPSKQYQILESEVQQTGRYPVISQSKAYSIGFSDDSDKVYHYTKPVIVFGDHTTEVKHVEFDFVVGADGVKIFEPIDGIVTADFLFYVFLFYSKDLSKVGGYSRHYKFIKNKPVPLPPLAEQKRIVAKIEELLPYIERYEQARSKLEEFNKRFPVDMQKSILQMAIQGKLVEQRPEEGTGEELFQQIQTEKQTLIKAGTIKKEKPLPEITEDEVPFDIPESWKWVRLGDCTGYAQTKEKISPKDIRGDMWSLDLEDIQKDTGAILVKTKASERKINGDKVVFRKGQVLYSKLRPYLKKILVAPDDGICTPEFVPFDTYLVDENYIAYVLKSPHIDYVINSVTYGVKMPRVGTDTMINLLIPLPSLAEQKRIVEKLEQLLPLCERLK